MIGASVCKSQVVIVDFVELGKIMSLWWQVYREYDSERLGGSRMWSKEDHPVQAKRGRLREKSCCSTP
jgi:hypothetical protein